jgi:hypothetical protein
MDDTRDILAAACAHPLNSAFGSGSGALGEVDFATVWRAVGSTVAATLQAGRGVGLPGLGDVTLLRPRKHSGAGALGKPRGSGRQHPASKPTVPVFIIEAKFAKQHNLRAVEPLPLSHIDRSSPYSWSGDGVSKGTTPAHPLSFAELGDHLHLPASDVANVFNLVVQSFGEQVSGLGPPRSDCRGGVKG